MTLFREVFTISFEAYTVYDDIDCEIAYGILRIEGIVAPALRLCMHRPLVDLAVKLYGDFVMEVKRAEYYLYIPPHCYITYTDTPDVLLLLHPLGGAVVLLCRADAETCEQLRAALQNVRNVKHAYTVIRNITVAKQQQGQP